MAMTLEEVSRGYERLRAVREIENIMGRYSFFHTSMRHIDYLKLWSQRDDCILDMPWGGYTGYKGVEQCYLLDHGDRSYPETQEFMIGLLPMHTHTTGVIEVAKDLKTARGCWLSPGHETFAEDGKVEGAAVSFSTEMITHSEGYDSTGYKMLPIKENMRLSTYLIKPKGYELNKLQRVAVEELKHALQKI